MTPERLLICILVGSNFNLPCTPAKPGLGTRFAEISTVLCSAVAEFVNRAAAIGTTTGHSAIGSDVPRIAASAMA